MQPTVALLALLLTGASALALGRAVGPAAIATAIAAPVRPAPSWANRSWLNADRPLALEDLRGRVVLLNFWVYSCGNCQRTVPSLVAFDEEYRARGLTVIGIHTPEFPPWSGEHDRANVAKALARYGIEYPNAQDNDARTWQLYGIRYWPSLVLIDRKGMIRAETYGEFHVGDAEHERWRRRIDALLSE